MYKRVALVVYMRFLASIHQTQIHNLSWATYFEKKGFILPNEVFCGAQS